MSISMHVVDAADGGPELVELDVGRREGGGVARVGAVPVVGHDVGHGVGGVVEGGVLELDGAVLDVLDLRADREERVAEAWAAKG